jgi:hypothetical protein
MNTYSLTLNKGARDREAEEALLDSVLLNALAEAVGLSERVPTSLLPGEVVAVEPKREEDGLTAFFRGVMPVHCIDPDGRLRSDAPRPAVLLPGAFNPLHEGHRKLAGITSSLKQAPVAFELSVTNVDKPPLGAEEVRQRVGQFTWYAPVWLTRAPTFEEKAALFPGVAFVVGADTARRIVAPHYYQDSEARMAEALGRIRDQACHFLVAGRVDPSGQFRGLADLNLPAAFQGLFTGIPENEFRLDLSSTEIRGQAEVSGNDR